MRYLLGTLVAVIAMVGCSQIAPLADPFAGTWNGSDGSVYAFNGTAYQEGEYSVDGGTTLPYRFDSKRVALWEPTGGNTLYNYTVVGARELTIGALTLTR